MGFFARFTKRGRLDAELAALLTELDDAGAQLHRATQQSSAAVEESPFARLQRAEDVARHHDPVGALHDARDEIFAARAAANDLRERVIRSTPETIGALEREVRALAIRAAEAAKRARLLA